MTDSNFADHLRTTAQRVNDKKSQKSWWQTFAPQLIDASERGNSSLNIYAPLLAQQIDMCLEKGLKVEKTARHFDSNLVNLPWYIISWGDK